MRKIISTTKKICIGYVIIFFIIIFISMILLSINNSTIQILNTTCEVLDPAPFPSIFCNNTLFGNLVELVVNIPVKILIITFFGFGSIRSLILLLLLWGPFFLLAIIKVYEMRRLEKNNKHKVIR